MSSSDADPRGGLDDDAITEQIKNFSHHDPGVADTLHPLLARLRSSCPVAFSERHGGFYVVTSQALIGEVAKDHGRFSSAAKGLGAVMLLPDWDDTIAPLFESDPPVHSAWRRVMQQVFAPANVAHYEPHIRTVTRRVIDDLRPKGAGDLVAEVATRIPLLVVAELLGIPAEQHDQFGTVARRFFAAGSLPSDEAASAGDRYLGFLREQIRDRRGKQSTDLLTRVVNARVDGQAPTEQQLLKWAFLMVAAGHLTTCDTIANTLMKLAQDHQLRDRVASDLGLIPALIEESVRYEAAVAATGRTVREDTVLGGAELVAGDRLLLLWGAGTRDEQHFTDPDRFDIDRDQGRELAWGAGVHRCLGQHLARLELTIVLEEFLTSLPGFTLAPGARIKTTYGVTRGLTALPVQWPVS